MRQSSIIPSILFWLFLLTSFSLPAASHSGAASISPSQAQASLQAETGSAPHALTWSDRWRRGKNKVLGWLGWNSASSSAPEDDSVDTMSIIGISLSGLGLAMIWFPPVALLLGLGGWIFGAIAKKRGEDETLSRIALIGGIVVTLASLLLGGVLLALFLATA